MFFFVVVCTKNNHNSSLHKHCLTSLYVLLTVPLTGYLALCLIQEAIHNKKVLQHEYAELNCCRLTRLIYVKIISFVTS